MNSNKGGFSTHNNNNAKEKYLVRKPSIKSKKPPEVKQTLTSKYRLLKANPLLLNELEKVISNNDETNKDQLLNKPLKTLANVLDSSHVSNGFSKKPRPESVVNVSTCKVQNTRNFSVNKPKIEIFPKPKESFNHTNLTKIDFKPGHFLSSTLIENRKEPVKKGVKKFVKPETGAVSKQLKPSKEPMRRSLSAQHFERQGKSFTRNASHSAKSQSLEELKPRKTDKREELDISTIAEEPNSPSASQQAVFRTPSHIRKTAHWTPHSASNRKSLFLHTPNSGDMSKRLNEWLKRRGKSLGEYHHLKCFGIHGKKAVVDEENKENVETKSEANGSFEDLKIQVKKAENEETRAANCVDVEVVAKEALQDLHKLILEGCPSEHCETWLKLIKEKHRKLEEEPEYWECRAALEQSKGNISDAVECYKTAIIQGAEVQAVDKSLDQLLQKFSLLNINNETNSGRENKEHARIVQDARNIFKSSIIQFAVQERTLKKKSDNGVTIEKKLIATPVRRSTRLSRSGFTSTPGVKIYSSLQEAKCSTQNILNFQYNKALND